MSSPRDTSGLTISSHFPPEGASRITLPLGDETRMLPSSAHAAPPSPEAVVSQTGWAGPPVTAIFRTLPPTTYPSH